ncbi:MAG: hypothetical protein DRP86_02385 [Candidatus Neomarinimicrobiota bacterium]|nr:MAG: hypothetical protein DRP86_02385 [Candidatus Neomarinimicrobiota bacterium]
MILQDKLFLALLVYVTTFYLLYGLIPAFRRQFVFLPLLSFFILFPVTLFLTLPGSLKKSVLTYSLYEYDILLFKLTIIRLILFSLVFITLLLIGIYYRHKQKMDELLVSGFFISLFLFSGNVFTALVGILFSLLSLFVFFLYDSETLFKHIQNMECFRNHPPQSQRKTSSVLKQDTPVIIILTLYFIISFIILMIGLVTG